MDTSILMMTLLSVPVLPSDIAMLIDTRNGVLNDRLRNGLAYAAAAGNVPDGLGGVQSSVIPPVHADGFYGGPAYTNIMPVSLPPNPTYISITQLADEWIALTRVNTAGTTSIAPVTTAAATQRVIILEILAGSSSNGIFSIGCYSGALLPITAAILSGPGSVSITSLIATVTGLSATIPTILRIDNQVGASNTAAMLLYPGGSGTATIGHSIKVRRLQVTAGPYQFPYIPPGTSVVSTVGTSTGNGLSVPLDTYAKTTDKIAVLGDSITSNYHPYLQNILTLADVNNFGVSGNTTAQILARINDVVIDTPDRVFLLAGINDVAGHVPLATTQSNITSIISTLVSAGITVTISTILPWKTNVDWTTEHQTETDALNAWILATFPTTIDLYSIMEDPGIPDTLLPAYDGGDHLHPSPSGSVALALSLVDLFPVSVKVDKLKSCFKGVPDGVEIVPLAVDRGFDSDTGYWSTNDANASITGGVLKVTESVTGSPGAYRANLLTLGQRYLCKFTLLSNSTGGVQLLVGSSGAGVGPVRSVPGTYTEELTCTGDVHFRIWGTATGQSYTVDNISIQKLNSNITTVACLVKMGAGSANEAPSNTFITSATVNDTTTGIIYTQIIIPEATSPIVKTYDLATTASLLGTWSRGEYHLKVVETGGGKFRVGNRRYTSAMVPIDANIVWSHATLAGGAAFDGSFNPLDFLRFFYTSTVPMWLKMAWVSDQSGLGDTEILDRLSYAGH